MMVNTEWLTTEDGLTEVMEIRRRVFLDECGLDTDYLTPDDGASILLVREGDTPVATGRIMPLGGSQLLGQVAVLPEYRGHAYGDFLVRLLIRRAYELGAYEQYVDARPQAAGFYRKLGFSATGERAGTREAIRMKHTGDVTGYC